jgi:hypothetical protein
MAKAGSQDNRRRRRQRLPRRRSSWLTPEEAAAAEKQQKWLEKAGRMLDYTAAVRDNLIPPPWMDAPKPRRQQDSKPRRQKSNEAPAVFKELPTAAPKRRGRRPGSRREFERVCVLLRRTYRLTEGKPPRAATLKTIERDVASACPYDTPPKPGTLADAVASIGRSDD